MYLCTMAWILKNITGKVKIDVLQPSKLPCTDCVTGINVMCLGTTFFSFSIIVAIIVPIIPITYLCLHAIRFMAPNILNVLPKCFYIFLKTSSLSKWSIIYNTYTLKRALKFILQRFLLYIIIFPAGRETFLFYTLHCFICQAKFISRIHKGFCCKRWADVYVSSTKTKK